MMEIKDLINYMIAIAEVLFVASGAAAVLLIAVQQSKTNMISFWDKVFLGFMIFGGIFLALAMIMIIYLLF